MTEHVHDVVVIGMGPVGLVMTALVRQAGHSAAVVEKHQGLYNMPRAGHVDHEIVRILQSVDCEGPLMEDSYPTLEYVWVNAEDETLLEFDWGAPGVSGYNADYMVYQPLFEQTLAERLAADPAVDVLTGWRCVELREGADHVCSPSWAAAPTTSSSSASSSTPSRHAPPWNGGAGASS